MLAHKNNTRGSVVIAALIITLITGSLVGLFLKTVTQEVANAHRARMGFQAINLAEAGVEYAMHAMITDDFDSKWKSGPKGFLRGTDSAGHSWGTNFNYIDVSSASIDWSQLNHTTNPSLRNDTRSVKVYVEPEHDSGGVKGPVVISEGQVRLNNGVIVRRQIRVDMEKGSEKPWKRGWANAIMGKDQVKLNGQIFIDSYISSNGPYDETTNQSDNGSVATNSLELSDLWLGLSTIVGRVALGASEGDLGKKVNVLSMDQYDSGSSGVNYDRVAYDFYAELPDVVLPTLQSPATSLPHTFGVGLLDISQSTVRKVISNLQIEFPTLEFVLDSGDILDISGNAGEAGSGSIDFAFIDLNNDGVFNNSTESKYDDLAVVAAPGYKLTQIDTNSDDLYLFTSKTQVVVDNEDPNVPAKTEFNGGMMVGTSASVEFYLAGGIKIQGNDAAMVNTSGRPPDLQIYVANLYPDTWSDSDMAVTIGGNGTFAAAIYAPQSSIDLNGGGSRGDVFGAIVGNTITMNGTNWKFHYDEDLGNINADDDATGDFAPVVSEWREVNYGGPRIDDWDDLLTNGL